MSPQAVPAQQADLSGLGRGKPGLPQALAEADRRKGDGFDFDYHLMWDHYAIRA
jgi:hypothetical protein